MKLSKRQLKRIIREAMFDEFFRQKDKQNLLEISGSQAFEDLKITIEELIQDYMSKTGSNRRMAIYNIELALSNQKRGGNIRRIK